ncbi:MAG: FAD-dependent monooxygenase [Bacteroidetes bacterium]|nr:FAD-dependent monooxygenase [Bacteroidota bacterium]MCB0854981.1 FAD-dependent monooxygenase [Bacteroidota bacterium]
MKLNQDDQILIIGGGIAGMTLAIALIELGFTQVRIFEKNLTPEVPKVPINLGTNVLRILDEFQLAEQGWQIGIPWNQMSIRTKNGKVLNDLDFSRLVITKEHFPMTANFARLHRILWEKLPADIFTYGEEFISFTQNDKEVEAHFLSGKSVKGNLLIGTDGFGSRVRLQMLGSSEVRTFHRTSYEGIIDLGKLESTNFEAFHKPFIQYHDKSASFSAAPVSSDQIGVSFSIPYDGDTPRSVSTIKELLPGMFEGWVEPISEIARIAAQGNLFAWEEKDHKPIKVWSQNRVILTGDAAHSSFPFMGIGMSLTMGSSVYLAKMLHENMKKVEKGIKLFEKNRSKATAEFNRFAERNASMFNWKQPLAGTLRNMVYQFLPDGYTESPVIKMMNTTYMGNAVVETSSLSEKDPDSASTQNLPPNE